MKKGDIVRFKTKFEIVAIDDNLFKITDDNGRTTWHYQYELELVKPADNILTKNDMERGIKAMTKAGFYPDIDKLFSTVEPKTESLEEWINNNYHLFRHHTEPTESKLLRYLFEKFAKEIDKRLEETFLLCKSNQKALPKKITTEEQFDIMLIRDTLSEFNKRIKKLEEQSK